MGKVTRRAFSHACAQCHGFRAEPVSAALVAEVAGTLKHLEHGEQGGLGPCQAVAQLGKRLPFRMGAQPGEQLHHPQDGARAGQRHVGQRGDIEHG